MSYRDAEKRREYMRAFSAKRKENRICEKCGKQDAHTMAGHWRCAECSAKDAARHRARRNEDQAVREKQNLYFREYRAWKKKNHFCLRCKEKDAYTMAGHQYCAECTQEIREDEKARRAESTSRQKVRERRKRLSDKRKTEGLCQRCGRKLPSKAYPYVCCERCRKKDRERSRLKREKTGAPSRAMYKELGLCVVCGRPRVNDKAGWDGKEIVLCERCYANALKWAEAGRKAFKEKHGMSYRAWATGNEFRSMKERRLQQQGAAKK